MRDNIEFGRLGEYHRNLVPMLPDISRGGISISSTEDFPVSGVLMLYLCVSSWLSHSVACPTESCSLESRKSTNVDRDTSTFNYQQTITIRAITLTIWIQLVAWW